MNKLDRIHTGICTAQAGTRQNRPQDILAHKRPPGYPDRPQRELPTWQPAFQVLPTSKRGPAIPPRNHRSTLARIPATHPPPRRKRHPPSVQPLRDYLFNRSESL